MITAEKTTESFKKMLRVYSEEDVARINKAMAYAVSLHKDQTRASGEPYITHPLAVAEILVELRLDAITIVAALCHDVLEDTAIDFEALKKDFGAEVALLVDGVTKISSLSIKNKSVQNAETIRKMLFAMIKDIRVILIKLADKLHNMRTLGFLVPEKQQRIARECLDIYAPLAGRLGISWIKDELEDLALKVLNIQAFNQIKDFVAQRRSERSAYLTRVKQAIYREAVQEGIAQIEVRTRAKHFYSIYHKMKNRSKSLSEIFDFLGIRILCHTEVECYSLLGLVHKLWMPISGRFKDYIAMPKANRYQSLHTTVMCYDGKLIEIQIRTQEMHQTAEYGIAAHWLYKSADRSPKSDQLTIINKVKSWDRKQLISGSFLDEIKNELLKDSIYVFTPEGDVVELPKGATPLDFAYHIHTEVGNHCQGAKADGRIIPLKKPLRNTQVVEIITSPKSKPHLTWLKLVKTTRARSKIRGWLNKNEELSSDKPSPQKKPEQEGAQHPEKRPRSDASVMDKSKVGVVIGKERNVMIKMANCCQPDRGDQIVGFISRGRGIIIHKTNCPNLQFIPDFSERRIEVEWETISANSVRRLRARAKENMDIFSEIESAIRKYKGHIISGKLNKNPQGILTGYFTIELENKEDFNKAMQSLRTIPDILSIQPMGGSS